MSETEKDMEIIALRSQLSLVQQKIINKKIPKPQPTNPFRLLWVFMSKFFSNWKSWLLIVKPETVVAWHRQAFKLFWTFKSRKRGRPEISRKIIALIKKVHKENPLFSPEKIYEHLVNLSIEDVPSPTTIAKYLPETRKPPTQKQLQSWSTFLKNHSKDIWSMDFFVVPTLSFQPLYVLFLISHERRKIEFVNVTSTPSTQWVKQQFRNVFFSKNPPKYLIHDNDAMFTSNDFKNFLVSFGIKSKKTSIKSPWQNGIAERCVGIFRRELLDHIIPFSVIHLQNLLWKYVNSFYNPNRTHQGIGCETPIKTEKKQPISIQNVVLKETPILGGLYHTYDRVA
jgi:putative transposase